MDIAQDVPAETYNFSISTISDSINGTLLRVSGPTETAGHDESGHGRFVRHEASQDRSYILTGRHSGTKGDSA